MAVKLGYDSGVRRLNSATVAVLGLVAGGLILLSLASPVSAQINGTPASVTSINSGGRFNAAPGVPASITSLGPNGIQPKNPFNQANPNPPLIRRHHHQSGQFFPAGGGVYVPYAYPVVGEYGGDASADQQENPMEDDRGGPTIFDRRGPGTPAPYADAYPSRPNRTQNAAAEAAPANPPAETPVPDQPQTLLVFKDGHQLEVQNYAVIGDVLYDLTPGRHHKIPLAELDLTSTAKQNDERGIDFRLPPKPEMNK
jgi:hypothetical protein